MRLEDGLRHVSNPHSHLKAMLWIAKKFVRIAESRVEICVMRHSREEDVFVDIGNGPTRLPLVVACVCMSKHSSALFPYFIHAWPTVCMFGVR